MSVEAAGDVGAELAQLYAEWTAANAVAAALLRDIPQGQAPKGHRLAELELAEARAASLALRYRSLSGH